MLPDVSFASPMSETEEPRPESTSELPTFGPAAKANVAWSLPGTSPLCTTNTKPLEDGNWKRWSVVVRGLLDRKDLGHGHLQTESYFSPP
ncbi:hypothetical protein TWF506_004732 [Arthrobotrys conoides]|uniref:Uncharacterized protein n=1 Tax=Arthrobotrys conoides TaxID=74498 RepID=A0AAN8N2K3_9PEZI